MRRLKTVRRPPIYPNGAQAISPVAPSPLFRCPHAVHRCPSVDSGLEVKWPVRKSVSHEGRSQRLCLNTCAGVLRRSTGRPSIPQVATHLQARASLADVPTNSTSRPFSGLSAHSNKDAVAD